MRYGFTKEGGFAAVDDDRGVAAYAYPSSVFADEARSAPAHVAGEMLADAKPSDFRMSEHYERISGKLAS